MMILFGGFGLVIAWLIRCGLYPGDATRPAVGGVTDDRFALAVREPGGPRFRCRAAVVPGIPRVLELSEQVEEEQQI